MKFSIIIPVRAINSFLKENIQHIQNMAYDDFEVIVVLDQYENYDFNGDTRFRMLASGMVGPGKKRNLGAMNATGDVLAFLDDDAYPSTTWLFEASELFEDESIYALGGPAVTPLDVSVLEQIGGNILESWLVSGGTTYRHIPSKKRFINDYPTVNLFVRKEAFNSVGGFSDKFWPGEDTKFCLDLVKKYDRKFLYSPKPIVYHHRRKLLFPLLKQVSRYGMHRGRFARIYPDTSRIPMYFIPSLFVLGLVFGPLVGLFSRTLLDYYFNVICIYFSLVLLESFRYYLKNSSVLTMPLFIVGVFYTHLVYGINFLIGFIKSPELKLKSVDVKSGNYIEG